MKHGLQSAEKRTCRGGAGLAHGKGKGNGNGRRPSLLSYTVIYARLEYII